MHKGGRPIARPSLPTPEERQFAGVLIEVKSNHRRSQLSRVDSSYGARRPQLSRNCGVRLSRQCWFNCSKFAYARDVREGREPAVWRKTATPVSMSVSATAADSVRSVSVIQTMWWAGSSDNAISGEWPRRRAVISSRP